MILSRSFPYLPTTYEIERVVSTPIHISVEASSRREQAHCPHCGEASRQVHSYYQRRLWQQPTAGCPVQVELLVHRFRCRNARCGHRTFAEPLQDLAQPSARRTMAQEQAIQAIGLALGGRAGARLARRLGVAGASPSTLLRHIRRVELPEPDEPQVVGVDDWAWRRGTRYGSILVDLQRHQPLDLLGDYSKEAIAAWLAKHPKVVVVVRDRSPVGRAGVRAGAPQALQVADRFHLYQNLTDQLAAGFSHHPKRQPRSPPSQPCEPAPPPPPMQETVSSPEQGYAQMQQLRAARFSIRAIGSSLGYSRSTVHRWLSHGCPQADWVGKVRPSPSHKHNGPPVPSSRKAAWLFVRLPQDLHQPQAEQLRQLLESRAELEPIYQLAQRFVRLLSEGDLQALQPWLGQAQACSWSQVRALARGLSDDLAAVQAALSSPYSNGPVEGQITRLKLLKRQGYGRASLELLRARLLAGSQPCWGRSLSPARTCVILIPWAGCDRLHCPCPFFARNVTKSRYWGRLGH